MGTRLKYFVINIIAVAMIFNLLCVSNVMADENGSYSNSISNFKNKLDSSVPKLLKRYNVPGTAIGIIKNGEVTYILNYGMADKNENKFVNNDTIFQVGSVSKSLSAWGVMHLIDEGKIGIDDPVEKYLTRWHLPTSKFNNNDVTIRRLLSHTAGLSSHGYSGTKPGEKLNTIEESLSKGVQIVVQPGSEFMYSGGGYTVLQLLTEEVTKKTFDRYMYNEILKPLGMEHSSYSNNFTNTNMSKSYGTLGQTLPNYNFTEEAAAGLKTTLPDFLKFIIASMDGNNGEIRGRGILKNESVDLMFTPVKENYGLGFCIHQLSDNNTLIDHGGANIGWRAQYGMIPEKKDGLVIFTNSDNGQNLIDDIFNSWEEYETGTVPQQYYTNIKIRNNVLIISLVIGVLLGVYLVFFIFNIKSGRRVFISKQKQKSIPKLSIRLVVPLFIGFVWCYFFYIYKLDIASMMPYGFNRITYLIIIWTIVLFISGLFSKVRKEDKI